jgi:hypothetical protein
MDVAGFVKFCFVLVYEVNLDYEFEFELCI